VIMKPQSVLQAAVDNEGTKKDFCSQSCLSSFNYKRIMSTKLPVIPAASQPQCSVCSRFCISKHEVILQDVVHKICSDPCFHRFCNINNLLVCENCGSRCNSQLRLKMEDGNKRCSRAQCAAALNSCQTCLKTKPVKTSSSCVALNCDNCSRESAPACHLAMSDASIRTFCCLTCAMAFKDQLIFVCSRVCSQEFKKLNNMLGVCERCRNKKVINEVKRIDNKDCSFCSDGCLLLFHRELEKKWGKHCPTCSFCLSVSKTVLSAQVEGTKKDFCSEGCRSNLNLKILMFLFPDDDEDESLTSTDADPSSSSQEAKCDTCGRRGKLTESLPLPGNVKHFCDLKCLLRFRNNKDETLTAEGGLCCSCAGSCLRSSAHEPLQPVHPGSLPVPVFLPEKKDGSEPTLTEKTQTASLQEEFSFSPERPTEQKGGDERETSQKEEETQTQSLIGKKSR
ncbi:hypothetical protein XENOCAPTIV_007121, partial [Xenoophorus captivus]